MFDKAKDYLCEKISCNERPLLALSGGPDSMLLLHLLLETKKPFEVAHIDHGWRKESAQEAKTLRQFCQERRIPFHETRLKGSATGQEGNLEDLCRKERYRFFQKVCQREGLKGVLLGHHKDDQGETVLKRVFEGASWRALSGMQTESFWEGLLLMRPLLSYTKQEILQELKKREIAYFFDPTNEDERFLRARMRGSLVPLLEKQFGKNISSNLVHLADLAKSMEEYLSEKVEGVFAVLDKGPLGYRLKRNIRMHILEFEMLIRKLAATEKAPLTRTSLQLAKQLYQKDFSGKSVFLGKFEIAFEQKEIFFMHTEFQVQVKPLLKGSEDSASWETLWKRGEMEVHLPENHVLAVPKNLMERLPSGQKLKKIYVDNFVPRIFRRQMPAIYFNGRITRQLLVLQKGRESRPANHLLTIIREKDKISHQGAGIPGVF